MTRALLVVFVLMAIADRAEAARCISLLALRVRADSLGFGKQMTWPAGTDLTYQPAKREWIAVDSAKGSGFVAAGDLLRACVGAKKVFTAALAPPSLQKPASQPTSAPASEPTSIPVDDAAALQAILELEMKAPASRPVALPPVRMPRERARDEALRVAVQGSLPDPLLRIVQETIDALGPFRTTPNDADADYVVTGSVVQTAGAATLSLQLADVTKPFVDRALTRTCEPAGLAAVTRVATKQLVYDVLERLSGTIYVTSSIDGATVRLDGEVVGVSPLTAFRATGGVHTLRIERDGFVPSERTIAVAPDRVAELHVELEPLPALRAHELRVATQKRTFAWVLLGTGAASVGTAGALFGFANTLTSGPQDLRGIYAAAAITAVVGVASLTACLVLFFTGRDPLRF